MELFITLILFMLVTFALYFILTPNKGVTASDILLEGGDQFQENKNELSKAKQSKHKKNLDLQNKLLISGMNMTVKKFRQTKILYAVLFTTASLVFMTMTGSLLFKVMACVSPLLYIYPDYQLKQKIKAATWKRKLELPGYLKIVATLLKNHTPSKAIKKSVEYAGPYLKPFVDELAMDLETRPGDDEVLKKFAQNLDITEAHTFVIAIKQASEVNKEGAISILDDQIEVMDKLRHENYNYLISTKPLAFAKWNFIVVMLILLYPFVIVYVTFTETMQSM